MTPGAREPLPNWEGGFVDVASFLRPLFIAYLVASVLAGQPSKSLSAKQIAKSAEPARIPKTPPLRSLAGIPRDR